MSSTKDTIADAAGAVADKAKDLGHTIADGASQAAEYVADKTGIGCGSAKGTADIRPHMSVVSSCGCTMGKVDHVDGSAIKLTKNDSPDGQHHFIPTAWVDHANNHVHLTKNSDETKAGWKSDAASCAGCA